MSAGLDYMLMHQLSRASIETRDETSARLGEEIDWDRDWLDRHCTRGRGGCRMVGSDTAVAVHGEVHANAPRVANRHHFPGSGFQRKYPASAVYVGRGTPLGNPYTRADPDPLRNYRAWLWGKMQAGDAQVLATLRSFGPETLLVCSCWPRPCHGDVIRAAWCWMRVEGMLGIDAGAGG